MNELRIVIVSEDELNEEQKSCIDRLEKQCFSDVDPEEADCFYVESFARVLAYANREIVGHLQLKKRNVEFDGRMVLLGGTAGVCVAEHIRRKGIATELMKTGLKVLKEEGCDVACLNADLSKDVYRFFYEKLGFRLMKRKISFEDAQGKIRYDDGTMFIPLNSKETYNHLMTSKKTFHYGKGYW